MPPPYAFPHLPSTDQSSNAQRRDRQQGTKPVNRLNSGSVSFPLTTRMGLDEAEKVLLQSEKGFAVVGISLDDGGWKVLKPFLSGTQIPYRMLLGDDTTAQRYGITNMPDTFLIDRYGRVAAVYTGLVDKDDVEANVRTMLSEH